MTDEGTKQLLKEWLERARQSQHTHRSVAKAFTSRNLYLGIISVVLSTIVGTSVFITLLRQIEVTIQITVGMLSMLSAILTALNTFLRYSEKSANHAAAASKYGAICRLIEQNQLVKQDVTLDEINDLRSRLNDLANDSPIVPERYRK